MKRILLVVALGSCAFAQKHPAVTIGIVTGTVGFGLCGINVEKLGACSAIGAGIGVALGGFTGLVTLLANTNAEPEPEEREAIRSISDEPPGLPVDAGVMAPVMAPDASLPPADAAPADAP